MLRLALVEELRTPRRRRRRSAPQPRDVRARWRRRIADAGDGAGERDRACCCDEAGRQTGACRRRSSSSCCSGCAISPSTAAPGVAGAASGARGPGGFAGRDAAAASTSARPTNQLAIGNIISSMRLLSSIDWPLFFERVSLVERMLRNDPAGAYAADGLSDARSLSPLGRGAGAATPSGRSWTSRGVRSTLARQR